MIQLRPDQEKAVNSWFDFFSTGQTKGRNPLIGMPTGYGKSLVIAEIVRRCFMYWPDTRCIVSTHRKELIKQNAKALRAIWPTAPLGIYSAGMKQRDTMHPIIFGGIQSLVRAKEMFGFRHFMLVDEVQLVSPEAERSYSKFIAHNEKVNPYFCTGGLSATLYRTGSGPLEDGGIFSEVIFDCTSMEEFNRIFDEGWLCRLIPKATGEELSLEGVGWSGNDYNQADAQAAVDKPDITLKCVKETIMAKQADNRKSCLIFAQGIEHAEHITQCLRSLGQNAECIHENITNEQREERITSFINGTLPYLVNNDILTTGFDFPGLDMISVMRLIGSPGLWVQILGRGTRPLYAWLVSQTSVTPEAIADRLRAIALSSKPNCLVLDFGANTRRLGTINNPNRPKKRTKGGRAGATPIKICPVCMMYNHASATKCANPLCSAEFSRTQKITETASNLELIQKTAEKEFKLYDIHQVIYSKMGKKGEACVMRVSYFERDSLIPIKENICFEYTGPLQRKARDWWLQRSDQPCPQTVDIALQMQTSLRKPRQVRVWTNARYPEITEYIW